jgi:predicted peptidase
VSRPLLALAAIVVVGLLVASRTQDRRADALVRGALNARTYTSQGVAYRYQLFIPYDHDPATRWPVVVALHGSREKGTDGIKQAKTGLGPIVLEQARTFPAVVVFPQVHVTDPVSRSVEVMNGLIADAMTVVNGDPRRLYLTGLSYGGIISYHLVRSDASRFAAVVPIATHPVVLGEDGITRRPDAEVDAALAHALRATPVWMFHGAHDGAIPADRARRLYAALRRAGGSVRYTEYPDGGHEVWERTYRSPELWSWLFAQRR